MRKYTLKVLWGVLIGVLTLVLGAMSILTFFGISPQDAVETVQVFVQVANEINIDGLQDLNEFIQELNDRDILEKLEQRLSE